MVNTQATASSLNPRFPFRMVALFGKAQALQTAQYLLAVRPLLILRQTSLIHHEQHLECA